MRDDLSDEELKLSKQRVENVRRKHNYLPFVIRLVEGLASRGSLEELVSSAHAAAATRAAAKDKANSDK